MRALPFPLPPLPLRLVPLLLVMVLLGGLGAAGAQEPGRPAGFTPDAWNRVLTEVSRAAEAPALTTEQVEALRARLANLLAELSVAKGRAKEEAAPLRSQLDALGPPPAEDQPPEPAEITQQRQSLNEVIAEPQGRIKQADLLEAQALELDSRLAAYSRGVVVDRLLDRYPYPLAPATIAKAVPEFFAHLSQLARAPADWWERLSGEQRDDVLYYRLVLILVFAVGFGWIARALLLSRLGRRADIENPTYARRLSGAIAEGLGNGLIPAFIFGGLLYRTQEGRSLFTGVFADMVVGFCMAMIIFFLVRAMARAALAPDSPDWRLEDIDPDNARAIARSITLIAAFFALDAFLTGATAGAPVSRELESLYGLVTAAIEAALLISLTRGRLWVLHPASGAAEGDDAERVEVVSAEEAQRQHRFWVLVRLAVVLLSVGTVTASLLGYASLSDHLLKSLLVSCGLVGGLYLLRGLFREVIGAILRSPVVQEQLGLRHSARNLIKFWTRALLDLVIMLAGVMLLLPVWGMPLADMLRWTGRALQGITIGNVTLSISDLLTGLAVFTVIIVITRMLQRVLSERVLPQTTLDSGVQNSLTAGLGYVGIALAAALGVTTIGLDLSNLAIIAGALSVGIGFGLQTVVNNFVSGLILLIERPIKVGDWIIAAGHEGYVKRINVRATELETFQRASVIIPNSELISSSVINWTHKNKLGRVEVALGVSYGCDVDEVTETLKDCMKAESRILNWPEPYVLFQGFGDSALDFEARGYIGDVESQVIIASDLRVAIAHAFKEKAIEIPFPQRDLHIKDLDRLIEAIAARGNGEDGPAERKAPAKSDPKRTPAPRDAAAPAETGGGEGDGDGDS